MGARALGHHKELLLDELSAAAIDYLKEVTCTKDKFDQAVKAGYLLPRLYDRAIKRVHEWWNVSLKLLDTPSVVSAWDPEAERMWSGS